MSEATGEQRFRARVRKMGAPDDVAIETEIRDGEVVHVARWTL